MALTDRRLAATALAIRLYQHDHAGKPPDRLEQLVPQYLPAVPIDPMASPSRAIGYRVAAEHPVLYSVGKNGNDDSASEAPQPNRYGELDEWDRLDRVFYLTSRPREVVYIPRPNPNGAIAGYAAGIDEPAPWERE